MQIGELVVGTSGHLARAAAGKPLAVTRRGRDYVTIVPTELWRRAMEALIAAGDPVADELIAREESVA